VDDLGGSRKRYHWSGNEETPSEAEKSRGHHGPQKGKKNHPLPENAFFFAEQIVSISSWQQDMPAGTNEGKKSGCGLGVVVPSSPLSPSLTTDLPFFFYSGSNSLALLLARYPGESPVLLAWVDLIVAHSVKLDEEFEILPCAT
jgi:hypothetical protein